MARVIRSEFAAHLEMSAGRRVAVRRPVAVAPAFTVAGLLARLPRLAAVAAPLAAVVIAAAAAIN